MLLRHTMIPMLLALCGACGSSNSAPTDASVDVSTVDAPTVDAPTVDVPTVDVPTVDVPTVDVPSVDVPSVDVPSVDAPVNDIPVTDVPVADVPPTDAGADAGGDGGVPRTTPRLAYVTIEGNGRPTLWVQELDGAGRRRVHFNGVTDMVPSQDNRVPPVSDERVIAAHHLAWSPDGAWLAVVVSTAHDQSEVVVLDADRDGGYVASANGQYVMPAVDWSPDGRRLAFLMSTQPRAGGLELVTADLAAHTWSFATQGGGLRGLSVRVRFDATGRAVRYSRIDAEEPTSPWNYHSSVRSVSLDTRAVTTVAADLIGSVEGISRDGESLWLLRTLRAGSGGSREQALILRAAGTPPAESTLATGPNLAFALLGPHDGAALAATADPSGQSNEYRVLRPGMPDTRVNLPAGAQSAALWFPAAETGGR